MIFFLILNSISILNFVNADYFNNIENYDVVDLENWNPWGKGFSDAIYDGKRYVYYVPQLNVS